jgi:CRISPR-associated protein Cas1
MDILYQEENFILLSALQHYMFCPRQCALIHLEQTWSENLFTAEGRILHQAAHSGKKETRGTVKTVTGLRRAARERPNQELDAACEHLNICMYRLEQNLALDKVRVIEGEAANVYFGVFNHLLHNQEPAFVFPRRSRRPPLDAVNCLLSFFYTLLVHEVRGALEGVGLDPAVGFLHRDRPGRPSLALDLMEEFRPYLADRLALTLINRGQLKAKQFIVSESGAVTLDEEARKEVLKAWQERKRETIEHPFLKESMPVGLLWHTQARLLARHLRNDLDAYPPFVVR